jgi:hypothetical protein
VTPGHPFPVRAELEGPQRELVTVRGPAFSFTLCCHGARELARQLIEAADAGYCDGYCDGYRHGDDRTMFAGAVARHEET